MNHTKGVISDEDRRGLFYASLFAKRQFGHNIPYHVMKNIEKFLPKHSYEKDCGKLPSNDMEYEQLVILLKRKIANARSSKVFYEQKLINYNPDFDFEEDIGTYKNKIEEWDSILKTHRKCLNLLNIEYAATKDINKRSGLKRSHGETSENPVKRTREDEAVYGKKTKRKNKSMSKDKRKQKTKKITRRKSKKRKTK